MRGGGIVVYGAGMAATDDSSTLTVTRIAADQTIPLRSSVLRAGHPVSECMFPGDDDDLTFHAGAMLDGRIVSIASLYQEPRTPDAPGGVTPGPAHAAGTAWRLRGMATEPDLRGSGAGRAALEACEAHARANGATLLWCNARTPAIGFYERMGWTAYGDEFEIPTAGPHYVMERTLD